MRITGWIAVVSCYLVLAACAQTPRGGKPVVAATSPSQVQSPQDPMVVYHQMGLIATGNPLPFVGKIAYFATKSADTTLVLASVSIPNHALSFVREGDSYKAPYEVHVVISQRGTQVAEVNSMEIVRVPTFKEINRTDESVIFQHYFKVRPGDYSVSFQVRDAGSARSTAQEGQITIPALRAGLLSTPVIVYEASPRLSLDSLPRILISPRSSAVFGQDSLVMVYLEGYGAGAQLPVALIVESDRGTSLWRDTVVLQRHGDLLSGSVRVPISRAGIGIANLTLARVDGTVTTRTPMFVSFGNDVPLISFDEMLSELRYYATPDRIRTLRDTPVERRGAAWAEFLRTTDPVPGTPEHEGLQAYFTRIVQANLRFHEEGGGRSGWLSDRGKVFVALGEPDQMYEQNGNVPLASGFSQRGRVQYWEYGQYRLRFVFYDESGTGRWRLTPASESDFQAINARLLVR
jgi:GWxTD domain-containing protein